MRRLMLAAAAIIFVGCTPSPECDQACADAVNSAIVARVDLDARANNGDRGAIEQVIREEWAGSGESEDWLFRIVWRESNFLPWARNRSGASGLFQLMLPLHNRQFVAVGCDPGQWAEARCNAAAARHLYATAGRSPWFLAGWRG